MALDRHRPQRRGGQSARVVEAGEGEAHDGEHHLVGAHAVRLGCGLTHRPCDVAGDLEVRRADGGHGVDSRVQATAAQGRGGAGAEHTLPVGEVLTHGVRTGAGSHHIHGVAPRARHVVRLGKGPRHGGLVRALEVRGEDLPGDGVHREVVHDEHKLVPRGLLRDHRLCGVHGHHGRADHDARAGVELRHERLRVVLHAMPGMASGASRSGVVLGAMLRPGEDVLGEHRTGPAHQQSGFPTGGVEHQAQAVVTVQDRLQRTREGVAVQGGGRVQHDPLRVARQCPVVRRGSELGAHQR